VGVARIDAAPDPPVMEPARNSALRARNSRIDMRSMRTIHLPLPALALLLSACSSSSSTAGATDSGTPPAETGPETGSTDGGNDAGSDATDGAIADAPAEAYVVPGTNFAFHHYYLGDTDRSGTTSTTAWEDFGTDIDGKTTTAQSTDVCTLYAGASTQVQVDGMNGIDNSWGANIIPIFETLNANFSQGFNQAVVAGTFTTMVDVVGLTSNPTQSGAAPGWGFEGASFPGAPTFTVADDWPVFPNWLPEGGLPAGSLISFPGGSIDAGTWSSGAQTTDVPILIPLGVQPMELVMHHASVSFVHATPTTAATGTVSGILYTQEFLAQLQAAAGYVSTSLCSGSAFDSIAAQIEQAQDILQDGTNVAGTSCDAISIGIGFDGVQIGPVQTLAQPHGALQSVCPEAGTD
jgi:hypothetical protein